MTLFFFFFGGVYVKGAKGCVIFVIFFAIGFFHRFSGGSLGFL